MTTLFKIENGDIVQKLSIKKAFDLSDGSYEMTIKKKGKRSIQVNKYYWSGVLEQELEGFRSIGYDWSKNQVHEFNKSEFNYIEVVNPVTGEVKRSPKSTTDLNNEQFMDVFVERIARFCAEWFSIVVLAPNQQVAINYE